MRAPGPRLDTTNRDRDCAAACILTTRQSTSAAHTNAAQQHAHRAANTTARIEPPGRLARRGATSAPRGTAGRALRPRSRGDPHYTDPTSAAASDRAARSAEPKCSQHTSFQPLVPTHVPIATVTDERCSAYLIGGLWAYDWVFDCYLHCYFCRRHPHLHQTTPDNVARQTTPRQTTSHLRQTTPRSQQYRRPAQQSHKLDSDHGPPRSRRVAACSSPGPA